MRRMLLLLPLFLAFSTAPAVQAQEREIAIRTFYATLVVTPEGPLEVTETIRFAFTGQWNGVLRDLSLRHRTGEGRSARLKIDILGVTDERGGEYRWEEEDAGSSSLRRLRIWIPGATDAERTVVLRYRVNNALRFFYEGSEPGPLDELYWNVTGNEWTMPIGQAGARVVLPEGVEPRQWSAYTGVTGATGSEADVRVEGGTVHFATRRPLAAGEGLTVAVGWEPGAIAARPSAESRRRAEALRLWPLGLPLLAFFFAFRSWRSRGRDPKALPVVVGYEPPAGLSPAELGTLVDHSAELRDITSTLVDLAVRGYVGIEERQESKLLGLFSSTEFVFHLRRPREEWEALAGHERAFLGALFRRATTGTGWNALRAALTEARRADAAGEAMDRDTLAQPATDATTTSEQVELSDLKNRFYTALPGIKDGIYESLVRRGYYVSRPDKVLANWLVLGLLTLVVGIGAAIAVAASEVGWISPLALGAAGVVSGIVLMGFGAVMPARTEAGARAREAALGFREFLEQVESDRYRRMITSPEMFERYLPHAMAFGVEGRWARAFDDLYREPPEWYSGGGYGGGFRASAFATRMHTLSDTAGSTMSSSPSSSSSGSGGGGSSGGGSGGGGGSGF